MDRVEDLREFLQGFNSSALKERRILYGPRNLLDGKSAGPLTQLMKEHGVTRLVEKESGWYIDSDGKWDNPHSRSRTGLSNGDLGQVRGLFNNQNSRVNPFFNH